MKKRCCKVYHASTSLTLCSYKCLPCYHSDLNRNTDHSTHQHHTHLSRHSFGQCCGSVNILKVETSYTHRQTVETGPQRDIHIGNTVHTYMHCRNRLGFYVPHVSFYCEPLYRCIYISREKTHVLHDLHNPLQHHADCTPDSQDQC